LLVLILLLLRGWLRFKGGLVILFL